MCKKLGACIVQCNHKWEIWAAKIASKFVPIKIILTHHVPDIINHNKIRGITGALGSGPQTTAMLHEQNKKLNYTIKHIDNLPMFYNQDKFLNYRETEDRTIFFKNNFGVTIPENVPLLCMVANLYKNINHKNHPLLLKALAKLNQDRNPKAHVLIAGGGPTENYLKNLAKELGIANEVHFLGFTDQTPGILHHADVFVLTSKEEAFGIVYLEAALMKKPLVGATNTGAENVIITHEKTGLLFKNDNLEDLVAQLNRLIDDKELRTTLGQNAYNHVRANHSNGIGMEKMLEFYKKISR
jgi:glycosyltransferase involved in cell wall biosynthesis